MITTYTFHSAKDHSIVAAFDLAPDCMATWANIVAKTDEQNTLDTRRYYVHNGLGVIAAFMTRNGGAHQILRDDYRQFDAKAKAARVAKNLSIENL